MKTKLLYISIFSLLFILQACKPNNPCEGIDPSDKVYTYNIPDSNKAKIPYTGTETLVFISNTGDTATLVGQGKDEYYVNIKNLRNGGGDCPLYSIRNYDNINLSFKNDSQIKFTLIYYLNNEIESPSLTNISFYINNIDIANSSSEYIDYMAEKPTDSILYIHRYYSGIYMDDSKTALFNKQLGIIKFKDLENKIWTLNTKK